MKYAVAKDVDTRSETNRLYAEDHAVHEWYRFVLSFPAHLVRDYLELFDLNSSHRVLDPFCGTRTVLIECKKLGIPSEGIEANPMAYFATKVKTDWRTDPDRLVEHARLIATMAGDMLACDGIEDSPIFGITPNQPINLRTLSAEDMKLLLDNSISPLPLHKTLVLLDCIRKNFHQDFSQYELLAFSKSTVSSSSNLRFGPEVGLGVIKEDAPVISAWLNNIQTIALDLRKMVKYGNATPSYVHLQDARDIFQILEPNSIDAVITSPPYPNEKDYTRTTRLESVLLGFIQNKADLQTLKKALLCSNTRTVYKGDTDDTWIKDYPKIKLLADYIETERVRLNKTSGFERLYSKVTKLYFGGIARHLAFLRTALRPGAQLAYVVGDQASYFRVMIPTGKLLAEIAQSLGYELLDIHLFRNRFSTTTKEQLREEVVLLRWPGKTTTRRLSTISSDIPTQNKEIVRGSTMESLFPENEDDVKHEDVTPPVKDQNSTEDDVIELSSPKKLNRYQQLIEHIFNSKYKDGDSEVLFEREDIEAAAQVLNIKLPKNLGDIIYSFRYRTALPLSIRERVPNGKEWTISPSGWSRYCFVAKNVLHILPHPLMSVIKILDATPGIVAKYAKGDEQALLAKLRYNCLIDTFTRVTCYSLQNHLRTTVEGIGQVETDEIYVGVDRNGIQYVFPLQAKGGSDKIGITQIEQDIALCGAKFPQLVCRPLAAQFVGDDHIALFEFAQGDEGVRLHREVHYRLIAQDNITEEDMRNYLNSAADTVRD